MLSRWLFLILLGAAASVPEVAYSQVVVAFPRVTGPKPAGRGPTAQGVIAAFEDARLEVLRGSPLRAAAEELGSSVYSIEVAQVADCDYLAVVRLSGRRGAFMAKGQVFRVSDGKSVLILEQAYRNKAGATAAGRSIGTQMAEAILRDTQFAQSVSETDEFDEPSEEAVFGQPDEFEEDTFDDTLATNMGASDDGFAESSVPEVDEEPSDPGRSSTLRSDVRDASDMAASLEQRMLQFSLNVGSRLSTGYTLLGAGGGESTLSYTLDPLLAVNAQAAVYLPLGLTADLSFGFSPASFNLQIASADIQNPNPTSQLIDLAGNVGWRFNFLSLGSGGKLGVIPIIAVDYGATLVEEQGAEVSAVNAFSSFAIGGGVRVLLDLPPRWGVDLEGKGGAIVSYDESPLASGANGSGFRLSGRLRARYWVWNNLGAQLSVQYEQRSVSLEGPADPLRAALQSEVLEDVTIDMNAADVMLGVVLAI